MKTIIKKLRRFISDDELLNDLKQVSAALGKNTVSIREYDKHGSFNSSTLITRFGSWCKAVRSAGLRPFKIQNPSKPQLLRSLIDVWLKLGRQPKLREMTSGISRFSRGAYTRHFGSWYNALSELEKFIGLRTIETESRCCESSTPREPGLRLRMEILKRDRFKCVLCGASPAINPGIMLEIDHIVPWSKGGKTTAGNLQTLCSACNNGKGNDD